MGLGTVVSSPPNVTGFLLHITAQVSAAAGLHPDTVVSTEVFAGALTAQSHTEGPVPSPGLRLFHYGL